ncbi:hypothetical protein CWC02_08405 [Pseudoalteromonas sp. S2721]|uniref:hypothetical protein n=1 Tax=Pseudoalteromonas sp. S2721 TaxID=579526 RepID=UPI00110A409B|nr:hypothetical protein [Pseudoalteromonas sp. S2721]TMP19079.1 hypothetical protein CWC02_08405 [Pseudoalteromonas sp. S2721]
MSKVVDTVVDTGGDLFGIGRSIYDKTVGALWDSLTPDVPEEDLATLAKGLQKGIDQPRRITFGRDRVGGVIAHQAEIERDKKKFVQMVVLINGAPIDALEEIYIADKPLTEYPSESWDYELSDGRHTTANSKAVAKMAGWTAEHIGYGQAHIFVEFENNREVFPDGISDTEFLIRGARVWDPRDTNQDPDDETTWLWSQNAVLCALHYVRFYGAHEVPFERLPLEWWIAAINVCDEEAEFTDKDGNVTTEPRYTTNGSFTFTTKPLDVLNQLESCFAGKIFRQMGQWYVRVGAWYGNPTYTINADDVHGNIKIKWHADLRDRANVVRATFTDPEQNYERTDAPPVISSAYQERDNQVLEKSITLPFVRSSTTAQRLATIHLEQTRLGEIELPLKHKGLAAAVGRTVYLNLPGESITNKIYRVTERRFRLDGGVTLMCIEDGPGLWGDNLIPGAQDLTPNSDYLVGRPQPIFDVRVTIDGDGNGIVKWAHPSPLSVFEYDVEFYTTIEPEVEDEDPIDVLMYQNTVTYTQSIIPTLDIGEYTARISAKNIFGQRSLKAIVKFNFDKPLVPTISFDATYNSMVLTASVDGSSTGTSFQWQFFGTEEPVIEEPTEENTDGSIQVDEPPILNGYSYTFTGLVPETEYFFKVRTINVVGVSEWIVFSASTTAADITEFITNLELTQLSESAQNLINDINEQVDRLREGSENNIDDKINDIEDNLSDAIKDLDDKVNTDIDDINSNIGELNDNQNTIKDAVFSLDRSVALLDAEALNRIDIERVVFDLTAEYVRFREAYENRTAEQDRLVDAAVTVDPESGRIVNRAEEITADMLQEAYQEIDAVKGQVTTQVKKLEVSEKRIQQAESELSIQADKINQRVTYTEVQSEISSAIQALVPAYSWQFNSSDEGFTGVTSHNTAGYIVANEAVTSPDISYIAEENTMFRLRVRLHAGATWLGQVVINGAVTLSVPAPATSGWETLQVNAEGLTGYTGEITSLVFNLGPCDIDAIEIGKRGASDLALQDITTRTTNLEQEIDGRTGRMAQYATTIWVNALGYQKQSDVQQIIDSFNTTYKVSATLQEFDENDVLTKANNAQEFINGAEAYIEQQITAFIDQEDGVNAKFSMVNQRLDAQQGTITKQIAQLQNLEVDLNNASINDVLQAWNEFQKNEELQELDIKLALADEKLQARTEELKSVTEQSLALVSLFEQSKSALTSVSTAFSNSHQAQVKQNREFEVQHKDANAKFINVEQAIADETEARVQTEQAFQAEFDSNTAKFAQVNQAIASETEARVQTELAFQAEFDNNAAKFVQVNQALANETEARVQTEQAFQAEFDNNAAKFVQVNQALADEVQTRVQNELAFQAEFENNAAKFVQINQSLANETQARNTLEQVLRAKIENDDTDVLADAHEFTRTAVGYCLDANGNPTSESDATVCVASGGTWIAGPLAEYIANMQISDGVNTASIKQLRQLFTTVDGKLVARGGWTLDNNGRVVGIAGYNDGEVGNLDLVGDVIRQGVMIGNTFVPTVYIDNTDPANPVQTIRGRVILNDGYVVDGEAKIRALDGAPGADGRDGQDGADGFGAFNISLDSGTYTRVGNRITRTNTGTGWFWGVSTVESYKNCVMSARVPPNENIMLGLSATPSNGDYTSMDYALYVDLGVLKGYVGGNLVAGNLGSANINDVLSVELTNGMVSFLKNGITLYTSPLTTSASLRGDVGIFRQYQYLLDFSFTPKGSRGLNGARGAGTYYVATSTGAWSDSIANAAVPNGSPVAGDIVEIFKSTDPTVSTTKKHNGSYWGAYTLIVNGNALFTGSVDGSAIKAGTRIESPRIDLIGGGFMKIELASGFGPDNLWYWYGPKIMSGGLPNLSALTKANAIEWKDTGGNAYFGGAITSGVLSTALTTTDLSYNANVTIGPFGSNGGVINIVCSLIASSRGTGKADTAPPKPSVPSYTITLYELVSGSWVTRKSQSLSGESSMHSTYEGEDGKFHWVGTQSCSGSFTYTDNKRTATDRTYKLAITSRSNLATTGSYSASQKLTLVSQED